MLGVTFQLALSALLLYERGVVFTSFFGLFLESHQSTDSAPYGSHECSRSHLTSGLDELYFTLFEYCSIPFGLQLYPVHQQGFRYLNDKATV